MYLPLSFDLVIMIRRVMSWLSSFSHSCISMSIFSPRKSSTSSALSAVVTTITLSPTRSGVCALAISICPSGRSTREMTN